MKRHSSTIPVTTAVLQSVLAVGAWLLWALIVNVSGPGIDGDKPGHQVTLAVRLEGATLVMGLPLLWLTSAAILIWRRSGLGWWLCVLGDSVLAMFGLALVARDVPQLARLRTYPALYSDILYHIGLLLLPVLAIVLLFSRRGSPSPLGKVISETNLE